MDYGNRSDFATPTAMSFKPLDRGLPGGLQQTASNASPTPNAIASIAQRLDHLTVTLSRISNMQSNLLDRAFGPGPSGPESNDPKVGSSSALSAIHESLDVLENLAARIVGQAERTETIV